MTDARHNAATHPYDTMVIHIGLPDGNGLDLCAELRATGCATPILPLSARDGLSDKVGGLDSGADDYLTKPFDFPELTARIRALTRRPSDTHKPRLEHGDIAVDPASRREFEADTRFRRIGPAVRVRPLPSR